MNLQTMLVCLLFDIANLKITDKLLEGLELIEYAYSLDHATLYHQYSDGSWKTIHPRWDLQLLSFMYNEDDKGIVFRRNEYLQKAIESIFKIEDENIAASVIKTMYAVGATKMPIEIVENVMENRMPDYLDNDIKYALYSLHIPIAYFKLKRYNDA